jgi:hypothetical protein
MTDYIWPSSLVPNSSEWRLIANTASFVSPLSGTTRTLGRGGDRWACSFTFNNLSDDDRAILQAFLAQLRGQANRVYIRDHSYVQRGSFPTSNLLPDFSSATPWTASYSTLTVADGIGRITASSHTGVQLPAIGHSATVVNGGVYCARVFVNRSSTGTASMGPFLSSGTSASSYSTAAGLKSTSLVTSSTTADFVFNLDSTGSSTVSGDFADLAHASLSRCLHVSGASQTGSLLAVDGSVAASDLLAGDRIEVGGEYNMVAETFNGAPFTTKTIRLVRPMRSSPTNISPVIVHDPLCKMMLADQTVGWSNMPGGFSSMTVSFIEDIA